MRFVIEAEWPESQRQAQREFVASGTLPKECIGCERKQFEELGVVFGEEVDNLFVEAAFPDGWRIVPLAEYPSWSLLVDGDGCVWGTIHYIAMLGGRKATLGFAGGQR